MRKTTRQIAFAGLGAAFLALCAWISVPLPPPMVPFTLQTFGVCLVCGVFGWRLGLWAVGAYILLGAAGVPVFSGFRGGVGVLLGTTGGYIVGFLFTAFLAGFAAERFGRRLPALLVSMALGLAVCYAFGTAWFLVVYAGKSGPVGLLTALGWCVFPYLLPDAVKLVLAALLTKRLHGLTGKVLTA